MFSVIQSMNEVHLQIPLQKCLKVYWYWFPLSILPYSEHSDL